jgi:uncharacterized membrane protein
VVFALTFIAAIGSSLVAGIFFAFSSFVMEALRRVPAEQGSAAMQSINVTVLNPGFFLAFFGTGIVSLALTVGVFFGHAREPTLILTASFLYLAGCIGVTMVFNVPLNNRLAAVQPGTMEGDAMWSRYLDAWTVWNHVRTITPLVSAILFTAALS